MKRTKIFATIITLCLAISTLAYGVYAAANLSFGIIANVAFVVDNVFFELQMNIKGAYDQGGTALGDLNYNYNTTGVANPRETYSDTTLVTDEMLNTWVNSLSIPDLYFNPNAITPLQIEVVVRNRTPNKNLVVEIYEWDNENSKRIETYESSLISYADVMDEAGMAYNYDATAIQNDETNELINETAKANIEYRLLNLASPITIRNFKWKIAIKSYAVDPATNFDLTGTTLNKYTGTSNAVFVPRGVTTIGSNNTYGIFSDGENYVDYFINNETNANLIKEYIKTKKGWTNENYDTNFSNLSEIQQYELQATALREESIGPLYLKLPMSCLTIESNSISGNIPLQYVDLGGTTTLNDYSFRDDYDTGAILVKNLKMKNVVNIGVINDCALGLVQQLVFSSNFTNMISENYYKVMLYGICNCKYIK